MSLPSKIWQLLTPVERRRAMVLIALMFVAMGLETLGVGLLIPTLALLTQPDYATKFQAIQPVLRALGHPSAETIVIGAMLILVITYAIKALFLGFVAWRQTSFAYGVQEQLSQRLFTLYLQQPYAFFLQRNSAQLLHTTVSEINRFTAYTMIPSLSIVAESLVFAGLAILLLTVEPLGALITGGVLGGVGWIFQSLVRRRVIHWGKMRQHHEGLRTQHLQQGLSGAKDVKVLGREAEFLDQFRTHNLESTRMVRLEQTLAAMPRLGLELLAVTALAALVLTLLAQGRAVDSVLPKLGLFGAAAFRLLPSVTRLLGSIQLLHYGMPVVDTLRAELGLPVPAPTPRQGPARRFERAIELQQVCYTYAGRSDPALDRIDLTIRCGESVGFLGESGAGKSTLVDVLLGLLTPASGCVRVDGRDIEEDLRSWQNQIGYVPQTIFLTDDTLRRNVAFCLPSSQIDEAAVERALRAAQLDEFVRDLPEGLDTMVGERGVRLSGGQRQRIGLARALYHDPAVLVLDEATAALDTATESNVMEAVKALQGQKTLIIVAHRLSTLQRCDRLYRLEHGRVVEQGSYAAVVKGALADAGAR